MKNPTEVNMNNRTRPNTAIDNHSPELNILYNSSHNYNILILLKTR
ncbi:protein of unknown function [Candidatus Nitrosocosmicus franklandus]|uniref:Uncharacterized protein n=1 Tax=Candidatus Nitrosocosmicus franklandianus TaxID=1798806 RepID=A0A484ICF0_9ARCH|nr:protein of unknown function [Candidatus Nitrosocosmicus franklandus]